jgi:hypothetical protein
VQYTRPFRGRRLARSAGPIPVWRTYGLVDPRIQHVIPATRRLLTNSGPSGVDLRPGFPPRGNKLPGGIDSGRVLALSGNWFALAGRSFGPVAPGGVGDCHRRTSAALVHEASVSGAATATEGACRLSPDRPALRPIECNSAVAERDPGVVTHHDVIEHGDVEEPTGCQRFSSQVEVVRGWRRVA